MSDDNALPPRSRVVQDHLRREGVPAAVRELPGSTRTARDAATTLGCPLGAIASSLIFVVDGTPTLVMTSGRHRVDVPTLGAVLHADQVEMADPQEVKRVTGQAIGGVAPVGHPHPLPAVVDAALADYETIWSAAGTPRTVVPLTFDRLVALTGGVIAAVGDD